MMVEWCQHTILQGHHSLTPTNTMSLRLGQEKTRKHGSTSDSFSNEMQTFRWKRQEMIEKPGFADESFLPTDLSKNFDGPHSIDFG